MIKAILADLAQRAIVAAVTIAARAAVATWDAHQRRQERSSWARHQREDAEWRARNLAEGRRV